MTKLSSLAGLVILALLLAGAACGDDDSSPAADAGPTTDVGTMPDTATTDTGPSVPLYCGTQICAAGEWCFEDIPSCSCTAPDAGSCESVPHCLPLPEECRGTPTCACLEPTQQCTILGAGRQCNDGAGGVQARCTCT